MKKAHVYLWGGLIASNIRTFQAPELSAEELSRKLGGLLNPGAGAQEDGSYVYSTKWVRELFPAGSYCVFNDDTTGKLFRQAYTVNGLEVVLAGSPVEVMLTYVAPGETAPAAAEPAPANPAPADPAAQLTRPQRLERLIKLGMTEHLQSALQEAANSGDVEAAAAIAGWMKKSKQAAEPDPAATDPAAPKDAVPAVADADPAPGPLYSAAAAQLAQLYPDHDYVSEDGSSVTISTESEAGERYWQIPVTVDDQGQCVLGDAVEVQPPTEPAAPTPATAAAPVTASATATGPRRAFFNPITPKLFANAATNTAWVNIINLGEYEHPEYGTLEITKQDYDSWVKNLKAGVMGGKDEHGNNVIAADYGHAMDEEVPAEQQKASGYIKDLKLVEDTKVFALVEFTPTAAEGIRNKEWSWWSVSFADLTDRKTGQEVGSALLGGALTNRPFIPDLEPIRLSDLRPAKTLALRRQLEAERAEVNKLRREKFGLELQSRRAALEAARIPPAVLALAMPLLEADFDATATVKLTHGGKTKQLKPGEALEAALLELAKLGLVPGSETARQESGKPEGDVTMTKAIQILEAELEQKGTLKSTRRSDIYALARKRWPHLRSQTSDADS